MVVGAALVALRAERACAQSPAPNTGGIHAAVARIVAPGNGSISYGSGTLVFANERYGLVITNWHVINEATGPISVHFPSGFYSLGTVQRVDRDWDLAIIAIRPPGVAPVPLASQAPRPGEMLTIAGYGSGEYRAASGRCTQYVAPGTTFPFEMVEVAVSARQGDSGGPIFNSRGELAGVLFGEGNGRTSGSYCGRVRWFLSSVVPDAATSKPMIAAAPLKPVAPRPPEATPSMRTASAGERVVAGAASRSVSNATAWSPQGETQSADPAHSAQAALPQSQYLGWSDIAGQTTGEQVKTVLAAIGVLALVLHALQWLGREPAKT